MHAIAFACLASPGAGVGRAALLAHSLRAFGGGMAQAPFLALVPDGGRDGVRGDSLWADVRAQVVAYAVGDELAGIPLVERAAGAACAEAAIAGVAELLVWMDSDSLVLREPSSLMIPPKARIGCRPVDLALIGSPRDGPPDAFWESVYAGCGVDARKVGIVQTTVDAQEIRAYFNAGCLVVRPEVGLLRQWHEDLRRLFSRFAALTDARQRLFFHQAILAGTILASLPPEAVFLLPPTVNYPLHLHGRMPVERRPANLGDLETCRYESALEGSGWADRLPLPQSLIPWIEANRSLVQGS